MRKALVVDDHPIVRATVKMVLQYEHFDVIVEAADGADAVQQARQLQPDLVVLDISMPKLDGLEAIRRIVDLNIGTRILVLTSLEPALYLKRCMVAGAAGFLSKVDDLDDLQRAVNVLMSGYTHFPNLTIGSVRRSDNEIDEARVIDSLSDRELVIFKHLAQGRSNKEIGDSMLLSNKTISTYKTRLLERFEVTSVVSLAEVAKRNSIV
ncbi:MULTISPECIES: response regulator transcription factor [Pseudomonas]|uniref:Response regulator n=1 Tax=Pseudomonas proteolytica TaxID=219574 RepID=A0AAW5A6C3_9PSED|nr:MULTISPECIES: response regulator transcription factor [Pseudomonas]KAA8701506.1 response regulator transcription factor [Pseudomonas proteolytica]MCF5058296.1 response regulator [Pseudomonas proteolytica]MCF5105001.1 response regulator [Pseudomonas proteolytica]OHW40136.1 DNA-binding response regulator [Pseudomonas sp. 06C 126]TWR74940.1 response regulator transcription factor [Pseudomonas proteolytica]